MDGLVLVRVGSQAWQKVSFRQAGTIRKIVFAGKIGADSCDSAFPLWSMERFEKFLMVWENGLPFEQLEIWQPWEWVI